MAKTKRRAASRCTRKELQTPTWNQNQDFAANTGRMKVRALQKHQQSPTPLIASFINWPYLWMILLQETWAAVQPQMFTFLWFLRQWWVLTTKTFFLCKTEFSYTWLHSKDTSVLWKACQDSNPRIGYIHKLGKKNLLTWTNWDGGGQPRKELCKNEGNTLHYCQH